MVCTEWEARKLKYLAEVAENLAAQRMVSLSGIALKINLTEMKK